MVACLLHSKKISVMCIANSHLLGIQISLWKLFSSLLWSTGELSPDNLRTKKSELRLYCDVLMQRVHAVKTAATASDMPDIEVRLIFYDALVVSLAPWLAC